MAGFSHRGAPRIWLGSTAIAIADAINAASITSPVAVSGAFAFQSRRNVVIVNIHYPHNVDDVNTVA